MYLWKRNSGFLFLVFELSWSEHPKETYFPQKFLHVAILAAVANPCASYKWWADEITWFALDEWSNHLYLSPIMKAFNHTKMSEFEIEDGTFIRYLE